MSTRQKIRCNNFSVPYLVDKTLMDSIELSRSTLALSKKMQLLYDLSEVGISSFILGGENNRPIVWEQCRVEMQKGDLPTNTEITYKVALNQWEALYDHFAKSHYGLKKRYFLSLWIVTTTKTKHLLKQ